MSETHQSGPGRVVQAVTSGMRNVYKSVALTVLRTFGGVVDPAAQPRGGGGSHRLASQVVGEAMSNGGDTGGRRGGGGAGAAAGMPTPWTFLVSGFSVTLFCLSILINRISALVPPRRPTGRRISAPIRIALRLPSLLALSLQITSLLAHALSSHGSPSSSSSILYWIIRERDDTAILWLTFLAVALAVLTEAFVRALDDDLAQTHGFNLLSFAFLLHIHSTPSPAPPPPWARTQLHTHLVLVLSELLALHTSFAFTPPRPRVRLPITMFFSIVGQIFVANGVRTAWIAVTEGQFPGGGAGNAGAAWDGTIWLSRAPEMVFEVVSIMSIVLRYLSSVLRQEEVTFEGVFGHPSFYPDLTDDYTVAIIKYGTSTLESTRLIGLSNEVDPILRSQLHRLTSCLPDGLLDSSTTNVMTAQGQHVVLARGRSVDFEGEEQVAGGAGLGNEVRHVDARERDRPVDPMARHPDQFWEVFRCVKMITKWFLWLLWRTSLVLRRLDPRRKRDEDVMAAQWRAWAPGEKEDAEDEDWAPDSSASEASEDEESGEEGEGGEGEEDDTPATTLLRDLSSPPPRRHRSASPSSPPRASSSLIPFSHPTNDDDQDQEEDLTPILLAHHLRPPSSTPLTRRRYRSLASSATQSTNSADQESFMGVVSERRQEVEWRKVQPGEEDEDRIGGRYCVVCLGEERCVILWPCRCLSICEDCRANLADRTPASGHLCPTCRTPVKGFSRIFIP